MTRLQVAIIVRTEKENQFLTATDSICKFPFLKRPLTYGNYFHGDIRKVNFLGGLFEIIACIIMSIFTNSLNIWYIN